MDRWEADVVLADGGVAHLRPIRPDDAEAVVAFHRRQSPESLYYRYFSPKPELTTVEVEHLTTPSEDGLAFVAFDGDLLIGIGRYDRLRSGNEAEVAFQADEEHRGRGGTARCEGAHVRPSGGRIRARHRGGRA